MSGYSPSLPHGDVGDSDREPACPVCGERAEWRDIEGHQDGGEWFCPLGCEVVEAPFVLLGAAEREEAES